MGGRGRERGGGKNNKNVFSFKFSKLVPPPPSLFFIIPPKEKSMFHVACVLSPVQGKVGVFVRDVCNDGVSLGCPGNWGLVHSVSPVAPHGGSEHFGVVREKKKRGGGVFFIVFHPN